MKGLSTVRFSSGQVVYREGDPSDALFFMLKPTADDDLEAGARDDEQSELTTETNEKGGGEGGGTGRVCPFVPTKRYFGEEGLVYRCVCVCVCVCVCMCGFLFSIDRANRLTNEERVCFLFGVDRANRLTNGKASVVAGVRKTQHAF